MSSPNGITCPKCKGRKFTTTGRYLPDVGLRITYHRCRNCETEFRVKHEFAGIIEKKPLRQA
jgi:hypothetical protein